MTKGTALLLAAAALAATVACGRYGPPKRIRDTGQTVPATAGVQPEVTATESAP